MGRIFPESKGKAWLKQKQQNSCELNDSLQKVVNLPKEDKEAMQRWTQSYLSQKNKLSKLPGKHEKDIRNTQCNQASCINIRNPWEKETEQVSVS